MTSRRFTRLPHTVLRWGLLLVATSLAGCGEQRINRIYDTCDNFRIGRDMTAVDWGLPGQENVDFGLMAQAAGDLSAIAATRAAELGSTCRAMAIALGADANAVTTTDPGERVWKWCSEAETAAASFRAEVEESGRLVSLSAPGLCLFGSSIQPTCEARCNPKPACAAQLSNIEARCDAYRLYGACAGGCARACVGSPALAIACEGSCEGTCIGACSSGCENDPSGLDCVGLCEDTCSGECRGTCWMDDGVSTTCAGFCDTSCDVDLEMHRCARPLTAPSAECAGSERCNTACEAIASTRVTCTTPSLVVALDGEYTADHQADLERRLASIQLYLPKVMRASHERGELLVVQTNRLASIVGDLRDPVLSVCLSDIQNAAWNAQSNAERSLGAAAGIWNALLGSTYSP